MAVLLVDKPSLRNANCCRYANNSAMVTLKLLICLLPLWTFTLTACTLVSPSWAARSAVPGFVRPTPSLVLTSVSASPEATGQSPCATVSPMCTSQSEKLNPIESAPSDVSTPITARLILSKLPLLNEPVALTFIVSSTLEAPGTTATIILPDGAVLVDGNLEWAGALKPSEPHILQATILFESEGKWIIEAKSLHEVGNGDVWGDIAHIYLTVLEEASHFGFPIEPPPQSSGQEAPTPPPVEPSQ